MYVHTCVFTPGEYRCVNTALHAEISVLGRMIPLRVIARWKPVARSRARAREIARDARTLSRLRAVIPSRYLISRKVNAKLSPFTPSAGHSRRNSTEQIVRGTTRAARVVRAHFGRRFAHVRFPTNGESVKDENCFIEISSELVIPHGRKATVTPNRVSRGKIELASFRLATVRSR